MKVVGKIKRYTAHALKEFPALKSRLPSFWTRSKFISSVGTVTLEVVKKYIENLNVAGMLKNHRVAKSIAVAAWGAFVRQCEYKGRWYGCHIQKVGRFFPSSKLCSACGEIHQTLKLSERKWICAGCGTIHHRDLNASRNILVEGWKFRTRVPSERRESTLVERV